MREFRAYLPVITGKTYAERMAIPMLHLVAPACVVSYPYALELDVWPPSPCILDSGAFALLRGHGASWEPSSEGFVLHLEFEGQKLTVDPPALISFMEERDLWGFTPDLPVPPGLDPTEAAHRLDATLEAGAWMVQNSRGRRLWFTVPVYEDVDAVLEAISVAASLRPHGLALGGLVPRYGTDLMEEAVRAAVATGLPVHVLGIGDPARVARLWEAGVSTVDSSTWARWAADGKSFLGERINAPSPLEMRDLMLKSVAFMNLGNTTEAWKILVRLHHGTGF